MLDGSQGLLDQTEEKNLSALKCKTKTFAGPVRANALDLGRYDRAMRTEAILERQVQAEQRPS